MPRPRGDNLTVSAPASAPVNPGQPASVPNRAKMATFTTDAPENAPELDVLGRLVDIMPTSNPIAGETAQSEATPAPGSEQQPPAPAPAAEQPVSEPLSLPEKYRGKSSEELAKMHQEAEKLIHSRDEEIRIAREYQNRFLSGQMQPQPTPQPAQPTTLPGDDVKMLELMLSKPTEFKRALINEFAQTLQHTSAQQQIQRIAQDNRELLTSEQFNQWAQTVPASVIGSVQSDPTVLPYLINNFKQSHQTAQTTPLAAAEQQRARLAEKTTAARTVPQGSNPGTQPTFTRAQLMKMQLYDPDKYAAMQPQILEAYRLGLVGD